MKLKYFMIVVLSLFSFSAMSFNWNKCSRKWIDRSSWAGEGLFTSTTSFFSSTGECAMIGFAPHDRRVFLAHNLDKLKDDFSKGGGDYSSAFAKMYGCDLNSQRYYSNLMKINFEQLTLLESKDNMENLFSFLELHFQTNKRLKASCLKT